MGAAVRPGEREQQRPLSALLGQGSTWSGDLSFEGRVRVDGIYRGRIYTEDVLEVGAGGLVSGEVEVATLIVAGTAEGNVRARARLIIEATGCVRGKVEAAVLEIRPGGRLEAEARIGGSG